MRLALVSLALLGIGCGPTEPACSMEIGRTGRSVPLCGAFDESAVCDAPGATARFMRDDAGRLVLIDGEPATCDASDRVVCGDPEVVPRCIVQPPVE